MTKSDVGRLPIVAIVLGVLAVLSGPTAGNSAVLLLGIAAIVLGVLANSKHRRDLARWGVGCGAFAVAGYIGIVSQQVQ